MRDPFVDDIFFTATLIEIVARETKNTRRYVAEKLRINGIDQIYRRANVSHCLSMEQNCDELIQNFEIETGSFAPEDAVKQAPSPFAIGQNYAWMVQDLQPDHSKYPETLYDILVSEISDRMTRYNNAFFYSTVEYLVGEYLELKQAKAKEGTS